MLFCEVASLFVILVFCVFEFYNNELESSWFLANSVNSRMLHAVHRLLLIVRSTFHMETHGIRASISNTLKTCHKHHTNRNETLLLLLVPHHDTSPGWNSTDTLQCFKTTNKIPTIQPDPKTVQTTPSKNIPFGG